MPDNRVELLVDGGPFFRALVDTIRDAQRYVYLQTYILVADAIGWMIAEALAERAHAGVEVALGYDGYGSLTLDDALIVFLKEAGVKTLEFQPVSPLGKSWPWTKRDHRKMVVADGRVGIVGGMNMSADYAAPADGGRGWRDTAVRVEGPAVAQLDEMFRNVWNRYSPVALQRWPEPAIRHPAGLEVHFVGNEGLRHRAEIRREYLRAMFAARRTIWIINAYFSPDRLLLRAIRKAARRGVDVKVIVAGMTDVGLVLHATRGLYGVLLRDGVRIYEWNECVLHAKTAVIDGEWSTVGSANLTHRTYLRDLEVNAMIRGKQFGRSMEEQFLADRAHSRPIELSEWKARPLGRRMIEWFAGLFRRLI